MPYRISVTAEPVAEPVAGVGFSGIDHPAIEKEQVSTFGPTRNGGDGRGIQGGRLDPRERSGKRLAQRIFDVDFVFAVTSTGERDAVSPTFCVVGP